MQSNNPNFGYGMYFSGAAERFAAVDQVTGTNFQFANMYNGGMPAQYGAPQAAATMRMSLSNMAPSSLGPLVNFDHQQRFVSIPQFSGVGQQNFAFSPHLPLAPAASLNALSSGRENIASAAVFNGPQSQNRANLVDCAAKAAPKSRKRRSNENADAMSSSQKRLQSHISDTLANENANSLGNANTDTRSSSAAPLSGNENASPLKLVSVGENRSSFRSEWLSEVVTAKRAALLKSPYIQSILRNSQQRVLLRKRASLLGEIVE